MAAIYAGPQLLQVGERSPRDKNYETSEVVMAAPGTVVAPIPRGLTGESGDVDPRQAIMLILMQILKAAQEGEGGGAGAMGGEGGDLMSILGGAGAQGGMPMMGAARGYVSARPAGIGGVNESAGILSQHQLGSRRLDLDKWQAERNTSLAQEQLRNEYSLGQRQAGARIAERAHERELANIGARASAASSRQSAARDAEDKWWKNRELDIAQQRANEEGRANRATEGLRGTELSQQYATAQRELNLRQAADEFARIMRGVSEAALPGTRAGAAPSFGLFG